ncbi:class I SAM-dependent methyltransferase [Candidatus Woesearchaeota archaeon]|nr:class I SAM-dependent methyltransferase [Candidatus Woesearchaeota archaeon]
MPTNVDPEELNYDSYETEKYDEDIIRSIPGHKELHESIGTILQGITRCGQILELGAGTGLTAELVLKRFPRVKYYSVDFSETMMDGARNRLSAYGVEFIRGDYAVIDLPQENDLVVSVIGIHHQETDEDKKSLFQRIYYSLNKTGSFIFGDLVTYRNPEEAALNEAKHFHHLVENSQDEETLKEWAHHHKYLNSLAPLEDQVEWLKEVGFKDVEIIYQKFNTALMYATK